MDIITSDAQANLGFLLSQKTHIEREVNEVRFAEVQFPNLIPVDTSASPFAKTVTYFSEEDFGQAEWINGNSGDVPMAGTERTKFETAVHTAGIGYGYGMEEMEQARMLGLDLSREGARSSRRAFMYKVEEVCMQGDASKGFEGLIDNSKVASIPSGVSDWRTASPSDILQDINNLLTTAASNTNFVVYADHLLLPHSRMTVLASRQNGDGNDTSILAFVKKNNAYTQATGNELTIRGVRELEDVNGSARAIAYRKSEDVLKLHMPKPHTFMNDIMRPNAMRYEVPGYFRLGGLDIRRPSEVLYMDGI